MAQRSNQTYSQKPQVDVKPSLDDTKSAKLEVEILKLKQALQNKNEGNICFKCKQRGPYAVNCTKKGIVCYVCSNSNVTKQMSEVQFGKRSIGVVRGPYQKLFPPLYPKQKFPSKKYKTKKSRQLKKILMKMLKISLPTNCKLKEQQTKRSQLCMSPQKKFCHRSQLTLHQRKARSNPS